ncbi:MAG TPA: hypothetical protein VF544_06270 [Pyrinomonadaceae bacterium]
MPPESIERLLDRLDDVKRRAGRPGSEQTVKLLAALEKRRLPEADSLIRFHEILLFLRAYPQSPVVLRKAERALISFPRRIEAFGRAGGDLLAFEAPEISGIAGTSLTSTFSYYIARWLAQRHYAEVSIDWDGYEETARLGASWPRFLPLLEEDALVEANVPYMEWLRAATGRTRSDLSWLVERFERLPLSDREKAETYDALKLWVRWTPASFKVTRTGMKQRVREVFYQTEPMVRRSDVSLARELEGSALRLKKLSRREGARILELIRDTSTIRYRELHGFTFGDAERVLHARAGRGVEFFFNGVPPDYRLPLRAYHSAFILRNGVPLGYAEGISLFERMEIGFNIYYTFREGESAWLYAQILRLYRQLLGVTAFSVDPYQIGFENEEGIESGAFWFYRKLGFRPVREELMSLTLREEQRVEARPGYRTSPQTLRKLSVGHMLFETPPSTRSHWDRFQVRNLALAVQRRMAARFGGDAAKIRRASTASVARALAVEPSEWSEAEQRAFENLSLVLALIPDLGRWPEEEKRGVARIIRAKAGAEESRYLRLMQRHSRLRREIIKLGSA